MERNDKGFKAIAVIALIFAIAGLSIAYAAFSASLNINGTATVQSDWSIIWDNLDEGSATGYASVDDATFVVGTDSLTVSGVLGKLSAPGDSITWTWDALNDGSIDAKVSAISIPSLTCDTTSFCDDITMTITYDGVTVADEIETTKDATIVGKELPVDGTHQVSLTITWNSDSTKDPGTGVTVSVEKTPFVSYVQD